MTSSHPTPRTILLALVAALVASLLPSADAEATSDCTLYVATNGSNGNVGSKASPFETIQYGAARAVPGDTVCVRAGTYVEGAGGAIDPGTKSNPITLRNYPGEYVLLKGALRLSDADYWIVDGINVTDDPARSPGSLVAFNGGTGWILRNSEIWGGRGTAQLLIKDDNGAPANDFTVTNNCIHDADSSGNLGTDHNIYLFNGLGSTGGTIERNILFQAPNGANIKIGGPGDGRGPADVTMRFNSMASAISGIIIYRDADSNLVERNLLTNHINGDATYNGAVVSILTDGQTNTFRDNAWHDHPYGYRDHGSKSGAFSISGHREVSTGFDSISSCSGFHPTDSTAKLYGRYAEDKPLPDDLGEPAPDFKDTSTSVFEEDIDWLAQEGITAGCNPPTNDRFCPNDDVTRGAMAAFLTRALDLAASSKDRFVDDDSSVFEQDIQAMAAAGITAGCNPPTNNRFCPTDGVTRGAMAAFLVRALDLPASSKDRFTDDDNSVFEQDIQALAAAGITSGCNPPTNDQFCPNDIVTRGQMAAFLRRALG